MEYQLCPSILAADFWRLGEEIDQVEKAGVKWLHIDIMDGRFVPTISMGVPVVASLRKYTNLFFDVHIMAEEPAHLIKEFAQAGADMITIHGEACRHLDRTVGQIKEKGLLVGVALNPATPLSAIDYILPAVDMVLIMTVNPGFGGQKLIPYTIQKVRDLKKKIDGQGLKTDIEVDGGITLENVAEVMDAGANIIVAGSAVFKGDPGENTKAFMEILRSYE